MLFLIKIGKWITQYSEKGDFYVDHLIPAKIKKLHDIMIASIFNALIIPMIECHA
jgi:hypothetical protein